MVEGIAILPTRLLIAYIFRPFLVHCCVVFFFSHAQSPRPNHLIQSSPTPSKMLASNRDDITIIKFTNVNAKHNVYHGFSSLYLSTLGMLQKLFYWAWSATFALSSIVSQSPWTFHIQHQWSTSLYHFSFLLLLCSDVSSMISYFHAYLSSSGKNGFYQQKTNTRNTWY